MGVPFDLKCPKCGGKEFEKIEESLDEMTEGQMAEYLAGTWGTVTCINCGTEFGYD